MEQQEAAAAAAAAAATLKMDMRTLRTRLRRVAPRSGDGVEMCLVDHFVADETFVNQSRTLQSENRSISLSFRGLVTTTMP